MFDSDEFFSPPSNNEMKNFFMAKRGSARNDEKEIDDENFSSPCR